MDPGQQGWWPLFSSILDRTRTLVSGAPAYFLTWSVLCYLPVVAYRLADPIQDPWIGKSGFFGLFAACFVVNAAAAWHGVVQIRAGETPTVKSALEALKPLAVALAMTAAMAAVLEFLGALLIVPGLLAFMWIFFVGPIVAQEELKAWPAIDRGRRFVDDFRWTQVIGVLFLAWAARQIAEIVPRMMNKAILLFASEVPGILEWVVRVVGWSLDVVAIAFLSVWCCVAYFDIAELLHALSQIKTMELGKAGGPALQLPSLSLPSGFSPSSFEPPPYMKKMLSRALEVVLLAAIGGVVWFALQPQPVFERPPTTLAMSNVRLTGASIQGRVTNGSGRAVRKATWLVKLPSTMKAVPPSIVISNLNDGDGRDFTVPLPPGVSDVPEIKAFRVEWKE